MPKRIPSARIAEQKKRLRDEKEAKEREDHKLRMQKRRRSKKKSKKKRQLPIDTNQRTNNVPDQVEVAERADVPNQLDLASEVDERDMTVWIQTECSEKCANCCRHQISDPNYKFSMCRIYSHRLKPLKTPLMRVSCSRSSNEARPYYLCESCHDFLAQHDDEKKRFSWASMWPSFFWDILVGTDASTSVPFHMTYTPDYLWQFIPIPVRRYWLKSIEEWGVYSECSLDFPVSLFQDRTNDIDDFTKNISEYTYSGFLKALDPSRLPGVEEHSCGLPIVLPNVLCPWGCTEYCFTAKGCDPSALIQHHLRRVQLNMYSNVFKDKMHLFETSRLDYFRKPNESTDHVLMNSEWPILPSMQLTSESGLVCLVCRNHSKAADQKRLLPHPPRKGLNNLSSIQPANLCHTVMVPKTLKPIVSSKFGSATSIREQIAGFTGVGSAYLSQNRRFASTSYILNEDEIRSISHRKDISDLADLMVNEGKIDPKLRDGWKEAASRRYGDKVYDPRATIRGSSYVPSVNAAILQTHACDTSKIDVIVHRKKDSRTYTDQLLVGRSWDPIIYNNQVEDGENYGCPIKAIGAYAGKDEHGVSMMLWCLTGIVSSCADLHYAIDQKNSPHVDDGMSGNILCHISCEYMKHRNAVTPRNSPFIKSKALGNLKNALHVAMPDDMKAYAGDAVEDPGLFYRFNIEYFQNLFPEHDYPNLSVVGSVQDIVSSPFSLSDKKIFIVVSDEVPVGNASFELPSSCGYFAGTDKYEARSVMALSPLSGDDRKFSAVRMARHGNGFCNWWKQERRNNCKQLMKHYVKPSRTGADDVEDLLPKLPLDAAFCVTVYVRKNIKLSDSYRYDLYKSLGMQCQVSCDCDGGVTPLIVSGRKKEQKRDCVTPGCAGKEHHTCPRPGCRTQICTKCFDVHSKSNLPYVFQSGRQSLTNDAHIGEPPDEIGQDDDSSNREHEENTSTINEPPDDDDESDVGPDYDADDDVSVESRECRCDECSNDYEGSEDNANQDEDENLHESDEESCGGDDCCDDDSVESVGYRTKFANEKDDGSYSSNSAGLRNDEITDDAFFNVDSRHDHDDVIMDDASYHEDIVDENYMDFDTGQALDKTNNTDSAPLLCRPVDERMFQAERDRTSSTNTNIGHSPRQSVATMMHNFVSIVVVC